MDPVLCGSPTRDSACRAQVDVRALIFPYLRELIKNVLSHDLMLSRYKDFSECFPLWCEEQPSGAEGVFNTVSNFIETHIVVRAFSLSPTTSHNPLTFFLPLIRFASLRSG